MHVPFITCNEMLDFNSNKNLELWELALEYECERGNISKEEVYENMKEIVRIMNSSIIEGVKGTEYEDRILECQSVNYKNKMDNNSLLGGDLLNRIILYVTAIMEVKSSMGVIVAAPTAGSCGALPGAVLGVSTCLNLSQDETVKAMLTAGMIGIFISAHATFAAEVGGCMAECGSGSGMAAAAIVGMVKGSLNQSISAASVALQNSFGMVCDPIANRVEAPCLGKNIMAATNALSCSNMALANYNHLIPLDEVIHAMDEVAKSMPHTLRCTALGGLSVTDTSKEIEKKLNKGL
jgi:L-serine dehydratase